MKPKTICKIAIDFCLTAGLLLLMAYELIGKAVHEWIGVGMILLFILHHLLNWNWLSQVMNGKYTAYRMLQTTIAALVFLSMVGLMISGVILSSHVFKFLSIDFGLSFARTLHLLCAYWGFVLMSVHIGFHASMLLGVLRKVLQLAKPSALQTGFLRTTAFLIAAYGSYAFFQRQIGSYLFLQNEFVFWDFNEPLAAFFADYLAIMSLFACVGYYLAKMFQPQDRRLRS